MLNIISTCLFGLIAWLCISPPQQLYPKQTYWLYTRNGTTYWTDLNKAASPGIARRDQNLDVSLQIALTATDYEAMVKNKLGLRVEWYRFNRAKMSIFAVQTIELDDIQKKEEAGNIYYVAHATQNNILNGTWMLKISDTNNRSLSVEGRSQFDLLVF